MVCRHAHPTNRVGEVGPCSAGEERDCAASEKLLVEAHERVAMRPLSYCLMPNHWHPVLWPRQDGDLSEFLWWLTDNELSALRTCIARCRPYGSDRLRWIRLDFPARGP